MSNINMAVAAQSSAAFQAASKELAAVGMTPVYTVPAPVEAQSEFDDWDNESWDSGSTILTGDVGEERLALWFTQNLSSLRKFIVYAIREKLDRGTEYITNELIEDVVQMTWCELIGDLKRHNQQIDDYGEFQQVVKFKAMNVLHYEQDKSESQKGGSPVALADYSAISYDKSYSHSTSPDEDFCIADTSPDVYLSDPQVMFDRNGEVDDVIEQLLTYDTPLNDICALDLVFLSALTIRAFTASAGEKLKYANLGDGGVGRAETADANYLRETLGDLGIKLGNVWFGSNKRYSANLKQGLAYALNRDTAEYFFTAALEAKEFDIEDIKSKIAFRVLGYKCSTPEEAYKALNSEGYGIDWEEVGLPANASSL